MLDPVGLVKEGVTKTENGLFRIATLSDEFVVVTDREKVAEYIKAPDAVLNMQDGANEVRKSMRPKKSSPLTAWIATTDFFHHGLWCSA